METVEAVFEKGLLRPLGAVHLKEGQRARVTIIASEEFEAEEMIQAALRVYDGLSEEDVAEVEMIALERADLFANRE